MSSPTVPIDSSPEVTDPTAAANAAAADEASGPNPNGAEVSSMTRIGSLAELKEKSPKVYDAMMQGIATTICNRMKDHEERRQKIIKEYERH